MTTLLHSGIEQRVHPTLVPAHSSIAQVDGAFNAVVVRGDFVGNLMLEGQGAGAGPTASSVVSDIVDIARGNIFAPLGCPADELRPYVRARMRAHEGGYYVALQVSDNNTPPAFDTTSLTIDLTLPPHPPTAISVFMSADTLRLAEGYVDVRDLGKVPVKGLSEPVDVYELTGARLARRRFEAAAARGLTRFVGRDNEMRQLQEALEQAGSGHGR